MPDNRSFSKKITAKLAMKGEFISASEVSQETDKFPVPVSVSPKALAVPMEAGEGRLYLLRAEEVIRGSWEASCPKVGRYLGQPFNSFACPACRLNRRVCLP